MHYRKLLGYFMLPAMLAVVTIAVGAPREPSEDRVPSSAMKEALSYKAPFGEARTAPPEIVAAGKDALRRQGGVSSLPRNQRQRRRASCAHA